MKIIRATFTSENGEKTIYDLGVLLEDSYGNFVDSYNVRLSDSIVECHINEMVNRHKEYRIALDYEKYVDITIALDYEKYVDITIEIVDGTDCEKMEAIENDYVEKDTILNFIYNTANKLKGLTT